MTTDQWAQRDFAQQLNGVRAGFSLAHLAVQVSA